MSKESTAGYECPGCGQRIYYTELHMPLCIKAQARRVVPGKRAVAVHSATAAKVEQGPVRDQKPKRKSRGKPKGKK